MARQYGVYICSIVIVGHMSLSSQTIKQHTVALIIHPYCPDQVSSKVSCHRNT